MVNPQLIQLLRRCIHRGEKIKFDYITSNGKEITARIALPIDTDERMTLYVIDDWNNKEGCYKIAFLKNVEVLKKDEPWVADHYGKIKSTLKGAPTPIINFS